VSAEPFEGRPAFQLSGCNGITGNLSLPGGDEVDAFATAWLVLVDSRVARRSFLAVRVDHVHLAPEGTVTVPAGTYSDCWTAVASTSSFSTNTYCRGVGPVRLTSDTSDQVLTSTNL